MTYQTTEPSSERAELIRHMVNRFLAWKLPKEFFPDNFISFDREKHDTWGGYPNSWPTGTNLFTADQAKAMVEYLMDGYEPSALLSTDAKPVVDGERAVLTGFLRGIAAIIRSGEPERLSVKDYEPIEKAAALLSADAKPVQDFELAIFTSRVADLLHLMSPWIQMGLALPEGDKTHLMRAYDDVKRMLESSPAMRAEDKAGGEPVACSCAECGKTSTKDSMWALYCLDCIQEHGLGASNSLRPGYERLIDEYIENYEFTDGDAAYHAPSDFEQAMIKDAFMGFDFSTLYTHPQPQAELVPEGWKLVPVEPTEEMLVAGQEEWVIGKRGAMEDCEESAAIYRAIISAAPAPPAQPEAVRVPDGLVADLKRTVEALQREEDGGWSLDARRHLRRIATSINMLAAAPKQEQK